MRMASLLQHPTPSGRNGGPENRPARCLRLWGLGDRRVEDLALLPVKTSQPRAWRRPSTLAPRPNASSPTPSIPRFPIEHVPQRSTAQGAAKALPRKLRGNPEHRVATRAFATPDREILGNCCWALALAPGRRAFNLEGWMRAIRHNRQRDPPPIALGLRPATGLPLLAGPPGAAGPTPTPTLGLTTAGVAAVAALRVTGSIEPLAPLEQTPPTTELPGWDLCNSAATRILRRAQGSLRSQRSSLGGELLLPPRRFHLSPIINSLWSSI
jgi:hypothetical protein